ncbi:MAG TPA: CusA/CzcA family heavy metal efflux RND transporter [Bdellovibrionales bacterium]|nr:CusA/CzcA family heavy metal efflux RND transporter [Bdellovibrionales bacterium]
MISKIISFSVDNRFFVFLATLVIMGLGVKAFQELPIDAVPDITNVQVQLNTQVDGLVPEEIERMITFPVEFAVKGIPGVESTRSITRYGISQVTVIFEDDYDIFRARQLVTERLQNLELPDGITPEMGPISSGLGEIFHYAVEAKKPETDPTKRLEQLMELRSLHDWFIRPRLLTVTGVTEVNTVGGHEKYFYIHPNIDKMAKYGIHLDDIEDAVSGTNRNVGGGYIQQTGEQLLVRSSGVLKNKQDIENVVIKRTANLTTIKIKDIASVGFDEQLRTGAATINGEEGIIGTAFMLLGDNSRTVSTRVAEKLEEIKKDLPEWIMLDTLYDRSVMVNSTLNTVLHNLVMGAILVVVILLILIGNVRAALITSLTIPMTMLMTFILMKWRGMSGNLMSLGALDFGIIIDGAVIVVENCVHRIQMKTRELKRDLNSKEINGVVKDATMEIRQAGGFGQLIVIVVFVPIFALGGIEGKMFRPMALTFMLALVSAMVLSFTVVPALVATFLSARAKDKRPFAMKLAERAFLPTLRASLKIKKTVLVIGLISILVGAVGFLKLGSEFMPQLDEGDLSIQVVRHPNISLETSIKLQKATEKIIMTYPQVKNVFARIGAAEVATDPMGVNVSDSYVILHPKENWPKDSEIKTKNDLIEKIKADLDSSVPAQVLMFSQPVELRFNELLEGTRGDISAKLYGDDLDKLQSISEEMTEVISSLPNSGEVEAESSGKTPLLEYRPNNVELERIGLTTRPILDTISTALGGKEVGNIYDGIKKFPLVLRLTEKDRKNVEIIRNLPVGIDAGYTLPISKLADLDFSETYSSISRENGQRRIAVLINPETRDIENFVALAQKEVAKKIKLPEGYWIEWGGSFKNLQKAKQQLGLLVPAAMLVIIAMLYATFKNFAQVVLIFSCAPMALIGGVAALTFMGMPFSVSAGVGFIALAGISILNGVVLITYFNQLALKHVKPDDLATEGTLARLRPVLMTALVDIFGFLPMMFATGAGAEVQRPMATVVIGGIVSATLLTLIVLPTLYSLFHKRMIIKID